MVHATPMAPLQALCGHSCRRGGGHSCRPVVGASAGVVVGRAAAVVRAAVLFTDQPPGNIKAGGGQPQGRG